MLKKLVVLLGMAILVIGCGTDPDGGFDGMDGNAGFVAQEIAQAGKIVLEEVESGSLASYMPKAATEPDSFVINWNYDSNNEQWVANSTAWFPQGTVTRLDTVRVYDNQGAAVLVPTIVNVDSIWHGWASTLTGTQGLSIVVDVASNAKLDKPAGGDTTATINGAGTCKFEALNLAVTTVTDVVVPKSETAAHEWDYPASGTVNIDRPFRIIDITFTGGNVATATVTNKINSKTHTFNINLDTGEEYE